MHRIRNRDHHRSACRNRPEGKAGLWGEGDIVSLHPLGLHEVKELFPVTDLMVTGPALGLVTLTDKSPFNPWNKVAGVSCAA